ncbi:GyrI-like domain-containing protein [Lysobacter soli]|uniref:GyrI-like domain-containing protein n=1 Tax=Lysobacter soli TaxID=453783 RepID=UPI00240EFB1E|nr:GyrI-like domain-containing protein [Lysobacter soli]MDG2517161.1 GyrI-like domain-containing protein [Lysobacter soli]
MDEPTIERRPEQPYAGTRAVMSMNDFPDEIPAMTAKVLEWIDARGIRASGRPFLRYHVVDMPDRMDVELGIPIADTVLAEGSVAANVLPGGRYAVLTYLGVGNGVAANKKLIAWLTEHDEAAASHRSETGEAFEARYETFLTEARLEPDQDKWQTEIAIKLRE